MVFKHIPLLAFVAVASAGVVSVAPVYYPTASSTAVKSVAPVTYAHPHPILDRHNDLIIYNPHNQYKFAYEVNDEHTGDNHSHQEERDGDVVHGEYSLMDADGFKRIVQYNVDSHSGFNAVVNRIPSDQHINALKIPSAAPVHLYEATGPTANVDKQHSVPVAYHQHH